MLAGIFVIALTRVGEFGRVWADVVDTVLDHAVLVQREGGELDLDRLIDVNPAGIFVGDPDFRLHQIVVRKTRVYKFYRRVTQRPPRP